MIEVRNLTKKYGDHFAVQDISFSLEKGKIYGLLGPNGAGKSTTMNIMTGYIAATSGEVIIEGHDIFKEAEEAKKLAEEDEVMDDLRSSINERREAGQTDAEIFAALGPAKQAAAELTAQLPGYAFRKSPLRFVCLGAAVLALLAGLLKTVTNLRGFASVGVIGGADGPTEIFIAGPQIFDWADVIAAGIVLVLGLIGYLLLRRLPPKKG